VKLQEKPTQVLLALLEHHGQLVSRDALRRRLWHDHTFVDFDNGLNVCIRKLRDALGDDAPTARFVETIRGHGYRFIAPIQGVPTVVPTVTPPVAATVTAAESPSPLRWWPMAATALITVCALALLALRTAGADPSIQTLAVLPLSNHTGDQQLDLQVDGLTEAVTAALASRVQASVIASQSSFSLRNESDNLTLVAERLHAEALIVGQVTQTPSGVAIGVRLIETGGGRLRWSGRFERSSLENLAVADDIVTEILANVTGVAPSPVESAARTLNIRPDARAAFLRGRFFWAKRGQDNAVIATKYLSSAIELQPDYAEAWAGLADVYAINTGAPSPVIVPWPGSSSEAGIIAAREALRLSPNLGEAHAALGKLFIGQLRFAEAEVELRDAVRLSPNYSTGRQWLGTLYARLRRCDEARTHVEIGARLDPLTALVNEAVGSVYIHCGDPRRAVEVLEGVLRMHPASATTRGQLGRALTAAGRATEAVVLLEPLQAERPGSESFTTAALLKSYGDAGQTEKLHALAARVKAPYLKAVAAATMSDRATMYAELKRAVVDKDRSWLTSLLGELAFSPYIFEPEFAEIARAAGFPLPIRPIP